MFHLQSSRSYTTRVRKISSRWRESSDGASGIPGAVQIETGADISDVQAALGHKKIETSLRYAHRKRGRTRAKRGLAVGGMLEAAKPPEQPDGGSDRDGLDPTVAAGA
jgi:hypothetical protein